LALELGEVPIEKLQGPGRMGKVAQADSGTLSIEPRIPEGRDLWPDIPIAAGGHLHRSQPAEGCGRRTSAELARFVRIAMGSASELDYHLLLSRDFEFLTKDDYVRVFQELTRVRKMLWALLDSIEKQIDAEMVRASKYRVPSTKG
jgi:hypothetical protein